MPSSSLERDLSRTLARLHLRMFTVVIDLELVPPYRISGRGVPVPKSKADLQGVALFGRLALGWHKAHPGPLGGMRNRASIEELLLLARLESLNAEPIQKDRPLEEGLQRLDEVTIREKAIPAALQCPLPGAAGDRCMGGLWPGRGLIRWDRGPADWR